MEQKVSPRMLASVEAIFLTTFVLITQNQMARSEARRAELDLQISLLAEHEITRVLSLLIKRLRYRVARVSASQSPGRSE